MIRVDSVWLACEPLDMRAGTESALARVVNVFGEARPRHLSPTQCQKAAARVNGASRPRLLSDNPKHFLSLASGGFAASHLAVPEWRPPPKSSR